MHLFLFSAFSISTKLSCINKIFLLFCYWQWSFHYCHNHRQQQFPSITLLRRFQLSARLEDFRNETEMLRTQVMSEHALVKNLEGVLASNREKEFQTQLALQEKDAEIHLLKDRLALSDSKL